ncbi:hypothetical protein, partial [Streptomyces mirabilis]|uniref:hypothetical protein n=1 Tax=Streptomyces mirabilis TaxID=68239 RepID=UPI0036BD8AE4
LWSMRRVWHGIGRGGSTATQARCDKGLVEEKSVEDGEQSGHRAAHSAGRDTWMVGDGVVGQ